MTKYVLKEPVKSITSNVLSHAYWLSKAATQIRAISSLEILPCIYLTIASAANKITTKRKN